MEDGVEGDCAVVLSSLALSSAGAEMFTGSASVALSAVEVSADGVEAFAGAVVFATSSLATTLSGGESFLGDGETIASSLATSGAGTNLLPIFGEIVFALSPLSGPYLIPNARMVIEFSEADMEVDRPVAVMACEQAQYTATIS